MNYLFIECILVEQFCDSVSTKKVLIKPFSCYSLHHSSLGCVCFCVKLSYTIVSNPSLNVM